MADALDMLAGSGVPVVRFVILGDGATVVLLDCSGTKKLTVHVNMHETANNHSNCFSIPATVPTRTIYVQEPCGTYGSKPSDILYCDN